MRVKSGSPEMPRSGRSAFSAVATISASLFVERVGIARAAEERAQQHVAVGRAVRPLRRQPRCRP